MAFLVQNLDLEDSKNKKDENLALGNISALSMPSGKVWSLMQD